jgi:hypothetical protein
LDVQMFFEVVDLEIHQIREHIDFFLIFFIFLLTYIYSRVIGKKIMTAGQ